MRAITALAAISVEPILARSFRWSSLCENLETTFWRSKALTFSRYSLRPWPNSVIKRSLRLGLGKVTPLVAVLARMRKPYSYNGFSYAAGNTHTVFRYRECDFL